MKGRHLNVLVPDSWQDCSLLCGEYLYWESPECVVCLYSLLKCLYYPFLYGFYLFESLIMTFQFLSFRVRNNIRTHVGDVDAAAVPCGFGRAIGNKVRLLLLCRFCTV